MRIENNTIIFKSTPENFYKEREGLKPCTIRRLSLWSEMQQFEHFYMSYLVKLHDNIYHIKIINSITHEEFTRTISDITEFEGLWVISWRHQ